MLCYVSSETESTQQETLKRGVRVSGNTDPLTMSDAEIIAAWNALQPK